MKFKVCYTSLLILAVLLSSCGGGGSGNGADGETRTNNRTTTVTELPFPLSNVIAAARFLLFPNPQRQGFGGTDQTNTLAYAQAYYAAIDAANERDTLTKWKAKNGFSSGTGSEINTVFGDVRDLGYGRRMTARQSPDGCLAFFVENYLVDTGSQGYTYSTLNVDAAVVRSSQRFVSVSANEYCDLDGPGGANGPKFVKFFVFDTSGNRKLLVDQDGLGEKAMPNICVNCHGGRGDPLNADGTFPTVRNSVSQQAGDTTSRLQFLKVHTFDFSSERDVVTNTVRTRASQESAFKTINQWIYATYPTSATTNEWNGTVTRNLIEAVYGGPTFPSSTYSDSAFTSFVPDNNWTTSGQSGLYQNVVSPWCMTCHMLRGTNNQNDISFTTFTQFSAYADRIKAHVYDRGNMPLAKIVFEDFWANGTSFSAQLASVPSINALGASAALQPGRPLPDPGPDRFVRQGTLALSAVNSLYSSTFNWQIITNPGGATFVGSSTSSSTSINFPVDGTYVVRLTASASGLSNSKDITIVVDNTNAPTGTVFADIQTIFTAAGCAAGGCHNDAGGALATQGHPPLSYRLVDYANVNEFYSTVRGRINFTDVVASPILRKPSGKHHGGGAAPQPNFDTTLAIGDAGRRGYDTVVEWIMSGAPQ